MIATISDSILIAIIAGLPATITSMATLINSLKNSKKIHEIHEATNGMKDQLVASTAKASHFQGMADQRLEDKSTQK